MDGKWAIVSEYIKGKTLAQLMKENPSEKDSYISLMVKLQTDIFLKTVPTLPKLRDKLHRKICEAKLDATVRFDLHNRLDAMPKHTELCHGDFNPSNITIAEDGVPYISRLVSRCSGRCCCRCRTDLFLCFFNEGDAERRKNILTLFVPMAVWTENI